jgi:hypothetical protein
MDAKETQKPDSAKIETPSDEAGLLPVRDEEALHAQAHDAGVEAVARALDRAV